MECQKVKVEGPGWVMVEGKPIEEETSTGRGLYIASGGIMIEEVDFRSEVSGGSGRIRG